MKICVITGSNGLVGSSAVDFFLKKKFKVIGIDNNLREYFFGKDGSTSWVKKINLKKNNFEHKNIDIRNYKKIENIYKNNNELQTERFLQDPLNKEVETVLVSTGETNSNIFMDTDRFLQDAKNISNNFENNSMNKIGLIDEIAPSLRWAKANIENIYKIAKMDKQEGTRLFKGVTFAMQSLNLSTQQASKRINLKSNEALEYMTKYEKEDIYF